MKTGFWRKCLLCMLAVTLIFAMAGPETAAAGITCDTEKSTKPVVKTGKASEIKSSSAKISFKISSLGGAKITKSGIEYGYSKSKTKVKNYGAISETGTYKVKLTGLKDGKKVYYRAFAKNKKGTAYGSWKSFKTPGFVSSGATYRALLIGNSDYRYENDLPNHKYDVKSMKALLGTTLKTKYKVTDKYDCTASDMLSAIRSAFSGATEKDVSLFYFAGHGMQNSGAIEGTDGYCIYPDELRDALLEIPGQVIVLLECCHSGAYITRDGKSVKADPEMFNRKIINAFSGYRLALPADSEDDSKTGELMTDKFIVLTACSMYEESWNWWYYNGYGTVYDGFGTFTRALFNGLGCDWITASFSGSAPCDTDANGTATLNECKKYIGKWATSINDGMGTHNVQTCMSYGDSQYPLFRLK